jgi:hypothetical protein
MAGLDPAICFHRPQPVDDRPTTQCYFRRGSHEHRRPLTGSRCVAAVNVPSPQAREQKAPGGCQIAHGQPVHRLAQICR